MKTIKNLLTLSLSLFITVGFAQTQEIYISDAGNFNNPPWQIVKFDANGENPEVFIDDHLGWPQDIVFLEDDNTVLISNLNDNQIARFDASTGDYIDDFATGISGPTRMKIHTDGMLYALQWSGNGTVHRYQLDGTFDGEFTDVAVTNSIGLDWDSDGNLYVSSYNQNLIRKFDTEGGDLGVFIDSNVQGPTNIWFGDNGHLFVLNWNGSTVSEFDADGNFIGSFITGLSQPEGVDFLENGNILIGNGQDASVKLFDSSGNYIEDLIAPGAASMLQPNAVVLREVLTSATTEASSEAVFVYPTVGTSFYADSTQALELVSVEVYNASGGLVSQTTLNGPAHLLWDAENQSAGMYIILGTTLDGRKLSQKVMVGK